MLHADAEDIRDVDAGAETGAAAFDAEINADAELALLKYDADTGTDHQAYDANVKLMLMLVQFIITITIAVILTITRRGGESSRMESSLSSPSSCLHYWPRYDCGTCSSLLLLSY